MGGTIEMPRPDLGNTAMTAKLQPFRIAVSDEEIADLKRLRMQFEVNLRTICQSHIAIIDQSHLSIPDPSINLAQAQAHANVQAQNAPAGASMSPQQAFAQRVAAGPAPTK